MEVLSLTQVRQNFFYGAYFRQKLALLGMPAGMYIKRVQKSHRGSNKTYTYLHLVENVRTCAAHRSPNTG